jgi:hypothetical protein
LGLGRFASLFSSCKRTLLASFSHLLLLGQNTSSTEKDSVAKFRIKI